MNKKLKNIIIAILIAAASYFGYTLTITPDEEVKTEQVTVDTSNVSVDTLK